LPAAAQPTKLGAASKRSLQSTVERSEAGVEEPGRADGDVPHRSVRNAHHLPDATGSGVETDDADGREPACPSDAGSYLSSRMLTRAPTLHRSEIGAAGLEPPGPTPPEIEPPGPEPPEVEPPGPEPPEVEPPGPEPPEVEPPGPEPPEVEPPEIEPDREPHP
jgi:hypothetical protein